MGETEQEFHLLDYVHLLRRHALKLLLGLIIGVAGGIALYFHTPPTYEAKSRLLIEERRPRVMDVNDLYYKDRVSGDFYETQYRLIKSRTVSEAVVMKLRLTGMEGRFRGKRVDEAGTMVLQGVHVTPDGTSRLVWVSYRGPEKELAVSIVNAVVQAYKEATDARHKDRIDRDLAAERDELPRLGEMLRKADQRRAKFQEEHAIVSADKTLQIEMSRLAALSAAFTTAEQDRLNAERESKQLRDAGGDVGTLLALPVIAEHPQMVSLRHEQLKLEQRRIDLGKELGPKHPEVVAVDEKLGDIARRIGERAREIAKIKEGAYEAAVNKERSVAALVKEQEGRALEVRKLLATYERLCAEVQNIRDIYDPKVKLLSDAGASSPRPTTAISVVEAAEDAEKISPDIRMKVALGAFIGLLVVIAMAVVIEFMDDSVRGLDDLTEFAKVSVLSMIPHITEEGAKGSRSRDLICHAHPKSAASESFRSLRTSLVLSAPKDGTVAYLVTSAVPTEGKTTVAVNTAIVMAHSGRRVMVVDADLRRFGIHESFGLGNEIGLTSWLIGEKGVDDIIQTTEIENLDVVTSGPAKPNPSELLDSESMDRLVAELKARYDVVVIDSPPVTAVADPLILARKVDGVVQVVHGNRTSRKAVKRAKELLESVEAPLLGAVLNNIDVERDGYYYGYYRSRYHYQ